MVQNKHADRTPSLYKCLTRVLVGRDWLCVQERIVSPSVLRSWIVRS
jgi:hypothetical protein